MTSVSFSLSFSLLLQNMSDKMQEEENKKKQQHNDKGLLMHDWGNRASGVSQRHSISVASWMASEDDAVKFLISGTGNDEGMNHVRPILCIS
jgi:hypothetical protein